MNWAWRALPWAALAGGMQALALAWPGRAGLDGLVAPGQPLWWLQLWGLSLLVLQLQALPPDIRPVRRAALLGGVFGLAWLAGTFWWLFISMHVYGGLAAPLAVLAVGALAAFLAVYYALACALYVGLAPVSGVWRPAWFATCFTLAEMLRATWFTGFPWGGVGYAHVDGPLAPLAAWVGVYGITALVAWLAAGLVMWYPWPLRRDRVVAALLPVIGVPLLVLAANTSEHTVRQGRLRVALLQGQIPQNEKFVEGSGVETALTWYAQALTESSAELTVAPETALPLLPRQLPHGYWDGLVRNLRQRGQAALIGVPLGNLAEGYTNSVLGLRPDHDNPYRYDKHHLVPFGEFIPPWFKWFTAMMDIPLGDFSRGGLEQPAFEWAGQRLAPHICYEDLFTEELAARFRVPALAPHILVNVSNIAWFGNSVAIDQHLQIARLRAMELERPVVRSTNTGATVVIDHRGRVTHSLDRTVRGVLLADVDGRKGLTPYALWVSRWGLWPLWGVLLAGVVWSAWRKVRRTA